MAWAATVAMVVATACGSDAKTSTPTTTPATPAALPAGAQRAVVVAGGNDANLRVRLSDAGEDVSVALIGVEWPGGGECFAAESDAFAAEALPVGATVHLLADVQDASADGVLQRYAWDSTGEFYNAKALRQGFAKAAPTAPNERFRVELFDAEFDAKGAGRGVWGCPGEASPTPTTGPQTGGTTPATRPPPSTPATTVAPPATTLPDPAPIGRGVGRGQSFSIDVGETVHVTGEGLRVSYQGVIQDSRCPSGVQCVVAGNAIVAVSLFKTGSSPASLTLNTDGPRTAQYLNYTIELVGLGPGGSSPATLKVS